MSGVISMLVLATLAGGIALGWCLRQGAGSNARGPLALALLAVGFALLGAWMLPHHAGRGIHHGDGFLPVSTVGIAVVAILAARRRQGSGQPVAISGRKLAAIFAVILTLHATVIGSLMLLHHYHHL